MAGYWPSSLFLLSVYGPRPISSPHLDVKLDQYIIYYLAFGKMCETQRVIPSEQDSQSQCRIWFIFPAHGANQLIFNCDK